MVIFAAVAMVVTVIAGLQLLLITRGATEDSDNAVYAFLAIIGLGTPLAWSVLNLAVLATRGQTGGQYVAGVRLAREDGRPLSKRDAAGLVVLLQPAAFQLADGDCDGLAADVRHQPCAQSGLDRRASAWS